MRPLISFTSDFGLADPYVGTVKAVILSLAPEAQIVDVTHEVGPQAIAQAVFLTEQAWPYFPSGTVHLVVVDPGVGTERAAVVLRTPDGFVVGPDNGVLSAALPAALRPPIPPPRTPLEWGNSPRTSLDSGNSPRTPGPPLLALPVVLPTGFEAREIRSPHIGRREPSATFHGRDVFGPAAAYLAAGGGFEEVGPRRDCILALPPLRATEGEHGPVGVVVHVDRFGNLISSVHRDQVPAGAACAEILGSRVSLVRTYGESTGLVALIGSSGYLEVAQVGGSAAAALGAGLGATVSVPSP